MRRAGHILRTSCLILTFLENDISLNNLRKVSANLREDSRGNAPLLLTPLPLSDIRSELP